MNDSRPNSSPLPPDPAQLPTPDAEEEPSQGPSLVLLYSILAAVLVISMAIAALIVRPFYLRR